MRASRCDRGAGGVQQREPHVNEAVPPPPCCCHLRIWRGKLTVSPLPSASRASRFCVQIKRFNYTTLEQTLSANRGRFWLRVPLCRPLLTMQSVCTVVLVLATAALTLADPDTHRPRHDSNLEIYKRLFETKRKDQLNALKNLVELNDINQQYKIIDIMLKGLFKVLEDSRQILVEANMQPDDPFPMDDKIKEAYSHVVENTAFFGDVALRFPRIVHHYYDRNADWGGLLRWGLNFCNQTGVFTGGAHQHVLTLMSQELGITEKSPDFINPYRTERDDVLHTAEAFQKILREEEKRRRKEEKRKEIRKGPRISRSRTEL
nr:coiled-coil domain-containing protein 134 isoform X1 [Monopterus albus]